MKRVMKPSAALLTIGALSVAASSIAVSSANAQSLGGFPIREPGGQSSGGQSSGGAVAPGQISEVVVSQSPDSKVRTIAAAMQLVKPGGTIRVVGGIYNENIKVTKPVAILGMPDDYGRSAIVRPASAEPCVSISPDTRSASVSISQMIFEFDQSRPSAPCIDVHGGTVSVRDTFIIPQDANIPIRAAFGARGGAYGSLRPDILDLAARPPRDAGPEAERAKLVEGYVSRHAAPFGADNAGWDIRTGGSSIEEFIHARNVVGGGVVNGPVAGVRVTAGDARLDGNVIVGAQTAVAFESYQNAFLQGVVSNNVILGNGVGINAAGFESDLLLTRNTIRYNKGEGVRADVYDGMKILANEIAGNQTGIFLSEKVRTATVNSNFVALNNGDAMTVSTGFFGAVAANTFVANAGCTIDFYSAEQKFLNNADVKVIAYKNFNPAVIFEASNVAEHNGEDGELNRKIRRKMEKENITPLPVCSRAN